MGLSVIDGLVKLQTPAVWHLTGQGFLPAQRKSAGVGSPG